MPARTTSGVPNPRHPYGVRGVGETPIVPPLGAIANAMENATGIRFTELPMSPPRVRMARVALVGNLSQLTEGVTEFELAATTVRDLFRQLSALYPVLERHLED